MKKIILFWILLLLLMTFTQANPLIVAVTYDPSGSDGGNEWVELFNPTDETISLENYSLERGNGANEDDWTLIWQNSTNEIKPYSFFLLGEEFVAQADEIGELKLQNGPDAIRLVYNNTTLETIGWGDHVYEEYFQTTPVADEASQTLVRNYSIGTNTVVFTQTQNNVYDFAQVQDHKPRNHYFSLAQLLLPSDATTDVSYVLTIPNLDPTVSGGLILEDDVSSQTGTQLVVGQSSAILARLFVTDGNGVDDIVSVDYELEYEQRAFVQGTITTLLNRTNGSLDVQVPFLSSYPKGEYTLLLSVVDSQGVQSQKVGLTFEIESVVGVNVAEDVVLFAQVVDTNTYFANVSIENTGNVDASLDLQLDGELESLISYRIDDELLTKPYIDLIKPGELLLVEIELKPPKQSKAGRYTGVFRVVMYEATE